MSPPPRARAGGRRRSRARARPWWLLVLLVAVAGGLTVARLVRAPGPGPRPVAATAAVEVFFVRYASAGTNGSLVSVSRRVPSGADAAKIEAALRALLAGPSAPERRQRLVSEVPRDTALRGVEVRGGVVTVDLSGPFGQGGGSASTLARVWQVVYTATQTPAAHAVQLPIDGRRLRALGGEGLMVDTPLERPASMPTF